MMKFLRAMRPRIDALHNAADRHPHQSPFQPNKLRDPSLRRKVATKHSAPVPLVEDPVLFAEDIVDVAYGQRRKLAAILSADVVGYSKLMADNESATVSTLNEYRTAIGRVIELHEGRVVNAPGDNMLVEFPSAVEAVQAAVEIQTNIEGRNVELADGRRMHFRIGVNLGDVIEEDDGTIYGDGVNIAARMEALAESGGICITTAVHDAVEGKLDYAFDSLGEHQVKNIDKPVTAYRVRAEAGANASTATKSLYGSRRFVVGTAALAISIGLLGLIYWQFGIVESPSEKGAAVALALPDKPSIAVLPFANLSDDPEQEYFTDGLSEDLITDLSRIQGLFVIARNSSFTYKGKPTKVQNVAADLGVRYVLEGSVRRMGDSVRINAQLIDAVDGGHVWAERYEGDLAGIFDFQDQVLEQIVANLAVELSGAGPSGLGVQETNSVEAYDAFLIGREFAHKQTPEDDLKALVSFEKAIALDPAYGRAYAGLAIVYWNIVQASWELAVGTNFVHSYDKMLANVAKAKELQSAEGFATSAELLALLGRHEEAMDDVGRGLALEPGNPDMHISKARVLNVLGRAEEAEASARLAMRLDPHHQPDTLRALGLTLFNQRRYEMAAEVLERVINRQSNVFQDYLTLVSAYGHLGRSPNAQATIERYNKRFNESLDYPLTVQTAGFWWYGGDAYDYHQAYIGQLKEGLRKAGVWEGSGAPERYDEYRAIITRSGGEYSVAGTTKIDVNGAKALHDDNALFVDVRYPDSFVAGRVPGAMNFSLITELSEESLSTAADKNQAIVLYCFGKYCPWSAYACAKAVSWGFTKVYRFDGGFPAWQDAGYPVETSLAN
jgi:TolB-like protein/class 3 adenylate cyclase/rhodanese-related sulfurtransferase